MTAPAIDNAAVVIQRAAICKSLKDGVAELRAVTTHGGRFDEAQLRAWGANAPCAVVAAVGFGDIVREGGVLNADVSWATFLVTKDTLTAKRDEAALLLAVKLLQVITPEQRWDVEGTAEATAIKAQNLFGAKLDGMGVALWAITWQQKVDINTVNESALADFLRVRGDFDIAAEDATPEMGIAVDVQNTDGMP